MKFDFDIIVVGAGHAGCEAARAAALLGSSVLLVTMDLNKIAQMSCNPAIGGIAKGQIVREIDALGGFTAIATDRSSIQFRMLNLSKGPSVWSPRSQCDRMAFSREWRDELESIAGLSFWQDSVTAVLWDDNGNASGVVTSLGVEFKARAVIITAGTFLDGLMHMGRHMWEGGRIAEPASRGLGDQLGDVGIRTGRMKTGTPVRLDGRTIRWDLAEVQPLDAVSGKFSFLPDVCSSLRQRECYTVQTNEETHRIIREGLCDSPLYNGQINSIGPRYCPSIETKIVTFPERQSHMLHIEPEGADTAECYLNGFSSSLPFDVQLRAMRTIPALAEAQMYRPGYAIEYTYFDPTQLSHSLESKVRPGLYFAGQVNGTTGYEEAAAQGLIAGINAHRKICGKEPVVLRRDQAYIGVLIDDLVMKGVDEPYRMFTSRAEYRILLRQDNADERLTPVGEEIGLVSERRLSLFASKRSCVDNFMEYLRATSYTPAEVNGYLGELGSSEVVQPGRLSEILARPGVTIKGLAGVCGGLKDYIEKVDDSRIDEIISSVEIAIKYRGYIDRERENAEKLQRLDRLKLPSDLDYMSMAALSTEARQKLTRMRPLSIAQASRIPGVSPSDINVLLLMLGR
ncbi:MAG: tRNA uridine-5-carboxymethylaminomethyl(34) synthesis enzyme MnmG [Muribaculaceae bacterium]|nr:tRNA uridine-5-carboxymethylaminomethyl(34) synthesis enzyme MnmG [Muribaculaceae bacterium]